jgi:alcohol dehydrogenase class IV
VNFNYHLPVNLAFGRGRFAELGQTTATWGRRALVVCVDGSATRPGGFVDRACENLQAAGVTPTVFSGVVANPTFAVVDAGVAALRAADCDVVVGIGGGSPLDAAKAIAFAALNAGDMADYIFGRVAPGDALPLVLVPTTAGTGSEGNGFAVLTDTRTGDKKSLRGPMIIARTSLIDSELSQTMPARVLAATGFDALTHCFEAALSATANPVTTAQALSGIRLIRDSLPALYADKLQAAGSVDTSAGEHERCTLPADAACVLWDKLAWAATLGGMAIGGAGVTVAHGLEHPASGLKDITHGAGLAAITPAVFELTLERADGNLRAQEQLGALAGACGLDSRDALPRFVREFLADIGLDVTLGQLGIAADDIDWMAENALKVSSPGIASHPVPFDIDDIKEIYRRSL